MLHLLGRTFYAPCIERLLFFKDGVQCMNKLLLLCINVWASFWSLYAGSTSQKVISLDKNRRKILAERVDRIHARLFSNMVLNGTAVSSLLCKLQGEKHSFRSND